MLEIGTFLLTKAAALDMGGKRNFPLDAATREPYTQFCYQHQSRTRAGVTNKTNSRRLDQTVVLHCRCAILGLPRRLEATAV